MIRKIVFIVCWLTCLSCGEFNSENSGRYKKAEAPDVTEKTTVKQAAVCYRIDTLFNSMVNTLGFNGSVIVAQNGEVIYRKSFGWLDKKNNIPICDTSMFQLASVSKVITATSVLMLYEKGLIKLDDAFCLYFPDFPYKAVTIKHLLTHRSGLPNYIYFLNDVVSDKNRRLSNQDMLNLMIEREPKVYLKPNTAFNYCNTNYALLALLVEKVSKKTFSNFLSDEIFKPLGMKHSATIISMDIFEESVSKPYDTKWAPIERDASDYILGDKSVYSTPYDLFLFSEALYQNKLLKPETQQLAYTAYSREKKESNYGLGWRMKDFRDSLKKEIYHNGWWHGYRTSFHRRLRDKTTIVVLSNQLNRSAYQTYKIYRALDADSLSNNSELKEEE